MSGSEADYGQGSKKDLGPEQSGCVEEAPEEGLMTMEGKQRLEQERCWRHCETEDPEKVTAEELAVDAA
ncbi:MAG: hypothetical protein Q9214_007690 [Letrouitia sp. 1 TL-2023]